MGAGFSFNLFLIYPNDVAKPEGVFQSSIEGISAQGCARLPRAAVASGEGISYEALTAGEGGKIGE